MIIRKLLFCGTITITLWSCTKEGLGGDAVLILKPQHHSLPIYSTVAYADTIYIKFNTQEAPANPEKEYDAVFAGNPGDDFVRCEGLKHGDYYVYAAGWDPAINMRVVGGIPITIKRKERKDEIEKTVPVVE